MQNGPHWIKTWVRTGLVPSEAPGRDQFLAFSSFYRCHVPAKRSNISTGPRTRMGMSLEATVLNNSNNSQILKMVLEIVVVSLQIKG